MNGKGKNLIIWIILLAVLASLGLAVYLTVMQVENKKKEPYRGGCKGCGGGCGRCRPLRPPCTPKCDGKSCGPDGCGGACGACLNGICQGGTCVCTAQCHNVECGPDGCGGSCGKCPSNTSCTKAGQCTGLPCIPNCLGRICGPDGCDGSCGACPQGSHCQRGSCVRPWTPLKPPHCVPNCMGKSCGSDGCTGSCGNCPSPSSCNEAGQCAIPWTPLRPPSCVPSCDSRECGPNGCKGTCGTCQVGYTCNQLGKCVCTPKCKNKVCGSNGCGGTCGVCKKGFTCNQLGQCVKKAPPICVPQCAGKSCGNDTCGGNCPPGCSGTDICNQLGQCVPSGVHPPAVCDPPCKPDWECLEWGGVSGCVPTGGNCKIHTQKDLMDIWASDRNDNKWNYGKICAFKNWKAGIDLNLFGATCDKHTAIPIPANMLAPTGNTKGDGGYYPGGGIMTCCIPSGKDVGTLQYIQTDETPPTCLSVT